MPSSSVRKTDLSSIPSVDELLCIEEIAAMKQTFGHERVVSMLREATARLRARIIEGLEGSGAEPNSREELAARVLADFREMGLAEHRKGVRRVINATGVVVHTNLGRAPLSRRAVAAMTAAAGYSTIEFDIETGKRGERGPRAVSMLRTLTGAEDALVVNNCAAAAMLVLSVFAREREVVVSRGELVEIGGDFRIPDVLVRAGASLREIGTTNRTHLRDYRNAISERTAMILKVHPSNYRIVGFTKTPESHELAELAHEFGLIFYEDAGSGAMLDLRPIGVKGEPVIKDVIAAGADLVSFSGDKLLGGPQAGIIAGRAELVERLRKDPLYRALRVDKTITAALEGTLEAYLAEKPESEIPVIEMLTTSEHEISGRAERFLERYCSSDLHGLAAELTLGNSAVGGGASPDAVMGTTLIALSHAELSEVELERRLRLGTTPVAARIENGKVLIDLRTVGEDEESELAEMISAAAAA